MEVTEIDVGRGSRLRLFCGLGVGSVSLWAGLYLCVELDWVKQNENGVNGEIVAQCCRYSLNFLHHNFQCFSGF